MRLQVGPEPWWQTQFSRYPRRVWQKYRFRYGRIPYAYRSDHYSLEMRYADKDSFNSGYGFYDNHMDIRARFQERRSSNCPCFCFIQFMLVLLTWPHHVATLLQQNISFCPQESIGKVRSWRSTTMSSEHVTSCPNLEIMHVTFMNDRHQQPITNVEHLSPALRR